MTDSWSENAESGLDYSSEYLSWVTSPIGPPVLPGFYTSGDLIAFVFGVPRALRIGSCIRAAKTANMAMVADLGYIHTDPFARAGFRRSRRTLNAYLTAWSFVFPELPLRAMYVDVI